MAEVEPAPRLIVFTDATRVEPAQIVQSFSRLGERARPGSVIFMVRDYQLALLERWALAQRVAELAARTQQLLGLADRADLALALGCSAFHLPGSSLCASDARRYLGPRVFLSRGSHDPDSVPEPELDALLLSPIFEVRKGRPALGLQALARAVRSRDQAPALFALGAVDARNAASCLAAGAAGVAVIGAALVADPAPLLDALGILRG